MGSAASKPRKLYRPFDGGEFTVAWLTFKGDAIEDEEHRYVVKKSDLLSSKLFRALFGEITMKCFEEIPGDVVSKEALICILALSYEGNTEDRISYVFSMYNIVYSGERANEGCISEKDYLLLLEYLETFETLPKELSAVFEECKLPMAGILTFSQFVQWVRLYPLVMDFLARLLPSSPVYVSPALVRANDEFLNPSDPLNNSPSCRQDNAKTSNYSSFDFIGGEDSGDDSDELYDSDQISEMEDFGTSLHESSASEGRDDTTTSAKDSDTTGFDDERSVKRDDGAPSPPLSQNDPFYPPTSESTRRTKGSRSRNVQKMGRHIGKAVGGGISKVGHVGRSILHVGKSQGSSSSSQGQAEADSTVHTAGYSFSSETQTTKNFVCGYLHKVGDGKWSKRSWHRRWFVLDRQRGVLSYYRHNPAKHIPSSQHGNIVRMEDSPAAQVATLDSKEDEMAPPSESERMSEPNYNDNRDSEFDDPTVSSTGPTDTNSDPEQPQHQQQQQHPQQQQHHQLQHQNVLYLNKSHPWYRGAVDLNQDNASLFFEKSLAKNAPTSYFFQVSTLSLREIESKRGVQYKLCADNDADFDVWTLAIAEAINRKHLVNGSVDAAPVLSHQQLYHQGLLQEKLQSGKGSASNLSMDAVSPPTDAPSNPQPTTKPIPPPIVTNFTPSMSTRSDWNLEITVEGKKQCMILGFMVNIVAIQLLAGESVLWRFFICIAVTATYIMTIYNPRHDRRQVVGYGSSDATADISQCSDPQNCCLHKTTVSRTNDPSANGYGTDQRSRAPSAGSLAARTSGGHIRKFKMGSSMAQTTSLESGNSSGTAHAWSTTRAETFSVRGPEYKKLRRKQPSAPALFEFVAADIVRTDSKVELISQLVEFPPEVAKEKLFIINAQLPSYGPSVWGDGMSDGPGFSLVLYWKIPEAIHEELKDPKTTTLRLLKRFIEAGNDTSLTDRFKVIAQVTNQDECGLSGMAKKLLVSHNATPVLTRPQHRIYHLPDGSTEIDVDIHTFSYIARRGIHLLLDKTTRLVIDIAFVLQGETEDELPEQVLGCCRLDRADVQQAMALP